MPSAFKSPFKLVLGPLTIIDVGGANSRYLYGDLENLLSINTEFAGVEQVIFPAGDPKSFERNGKKNRWTTFDFTVMRIHSTIYAAHKFQLEHGSEIPEAGETLTITLTGYTGSMKVEQCAMSAAPVQLKQRLSMTRYSIRGGKLTSTLALSADISAEDGTAFKAEDGNTLQQG